MLIAASLMLLAFGFTPIIKADHDKILYVGGSGAGNYTSIQDAIDNATDGDTVFVYSGTYYEHLAINNKSIDLIGQDKTSTIIDCGKVGTGINISYSEWINISNFTVQNSQENYTGISVNRSHYVTIYNCIFQDNTYGVDYHYASNNTLTGNTMKNNKDGICLFKSNYNNINSNNIKNNTEYGIFLHGASIYNKINDNLIENNSKLGVYVHYSAYNILFDNIFFKNSIFIEGNSVSHYIQNIQDNTVNGKKIYYYKNNSSAINVPSDAGSVILVNCDNAVIKDLDLSYVDVGVQAVYSDNLLIYNCSIINAGYGIYMSNINGSTINFNNLNLTYFGLSLNNSQNNIIYYNNFLDSFVYCGYDDSNNTWYNPTLLHGNYWNNYTGEDSDGDGIGDIPYNISGGSNQDLYPLMNQSGWELLNHLPIANFSWEIYGLEVNFTDESIDYDGYIVNWSWDFGNGGTSYQQNPVHKYNLIGNYSVTLTVKDNDNAVDNVLKKISIKPDTTPPSKVTGLNVTDAKDGKLNLSWDAAIDDFAVKNYNIYWSENGYSTPIKTVVHPTTIYQHTGLTNGKTYWYKVSAVDTSNNEGVKSDPRSGIPTASSSGGGSGSGGSPPPINTPPIADAGGPYYEIKGVPIIFDGSESNDSDGTIESYKWDFGDGNTSTEMSPLHAYSNPGNYTVKLTVTDDFGLTGTDTTYALISDIPNRPPNKPVVSGNITGKRNIDYVYTAVATDADNDTIKYLFDWDDGTNTSTEYYESGISCTVVHRWSTAGIYKIKVRAVDEHEAMSATSELVVLIDSYYCEDIGYITDEDSNGIYDKFHCNQTGNTTNLKYQNGNYLIDVNGDGKWDYVFNLEDGLSLYIQGSKEKPLAIGSEMLVAIFIIVAIVTIAPIVILKRRTSNNKIKKEK